MQQSQSARAVSQVQNHKAAPQVTVWASTLMSQAGPGLSKAKCLLSATSGQLCFAPGVSAEGACTVPSSNPFAGLGMGCKVGICALLLPMAQREQ